MTVIVHALSILFYFSLAANLCTMIAYGKDDHILYFLGGKNAMSVFLVPAAICVMMSALLRKGRITVASIWFVILTVFSVIWGGSSTGVITVLALVAGLLWYRRRQPRKRLLILMIVIANIVLIFLGKMLVRSDLWLWFTNLMSKDATLTSRMMIWDEALTMLRGNWLFGMGRGEEIVYMSRWGYVSRVGETHNFMLEILFQGGIVGLAIYTAFFWRAIRNLDMSVQLHRVLFIGLLALLVNGLGEATTTKWIIGFLIVCVYICATRVDKGIQNGQ